MGQVGSFKSKLKGMITLASIAIIDDDLAMDMLVNSFCLHGHDAYRIGSADEALLELDKIITADIVVLDIIMPWPSSRPLPSLSGEHTTGMEVLKEIRQKKQDIPVFVYSAIQDYAVIDLLTGTPYTTFSAKWNQPGLRDLVEQIYQIIGVADETRSLQSFIVHGHDDKMKLELKNYIQNTLRLPEPIILHEQPNLGRTLIRKFEDCAAMSSIVFVILTPDDIGASSGDPDDTKRRARQNVIFEMGYFLGTLGRESGRVLLLYKPPLELPSDISGVVYINISNGIDKAGEEIRREIENVRG